MKMLVTCHYRVLGTVRLYIAQIYGFLNPTDVNIHIRTTTQSQLWVVCMDSLHRHIVCNSHFPDSIL